MEYRIHGGGLLPAIVATILIQNGEKVSLTLPRDPKSFLASWNSVEIEGLRFNNGYHAIEVARAPGFVDLLSNFLGIEIVSDSRPYGVWIQGMILGFDEESNRWPKTLFETGAISGPEYTHPKSLNELEGLLSTEGIAYFQDLGNRYGESWSETRKFFLPWFLPKNFILESTDEGDSFRNLLRRGLLPSNRVLPKSGLFENMATVWLEKIQNLGVELQISNEPKAMTAGDSNEKKVSREFWLSTFRLSPNNFSAFSETIVAQSEIPGLARVSLSLNQDNILLCESFHKPGQKPEIPEFIDHISRLGACNAEFIGFKQSRKIYAGSQQTKSAIKDMSVRGKTLDVAFNSMGPVNMAKTFKSAKQVLQEIKTI